MLKGSITLVASVVFFGAWLIMTVRTEGSRCYDDVYFMRDAADCALDTVCLVCHSDRVVPDTHHIYFA